MNYEKLPFLTDDDSAEVPRPIKSEESKWTGNDNKRMIELLEAIDWKLWMLYNMINNGELTVEKTEPVVAKKKLEKK
jgi:hypothetical protein